MDDDTRMNAIQFNTGNPNYPDNAELFIQNDYRCRTYELFAHGDLFPDSYLRYNHISYNGLSDANSFPVVNYGMLLEGSSRISRGGSLTEIDHSKYVGKTNSVPIEDKDYEIIEISDSDADYTKDFRRWGVIRLVEATFDWHFNAVDSEALKHREEISRVPITKCF